MITKKLYFKGDYAHEFGGRSRIWRIYKIFKNKKWIACLEVEPEDYKKRYRLFLGQGVIGGEYEGSYATYKNAIKKLL